MMAGQRDVRELLEAILDSDLTPEEVCRWADPDLAGLLDREALDRLPPAERPESRALWGAIEVLIRRAQAID